MPWYKKTKAKIMRGDLDLEAATLKILATRSAAVTIDVDTDQYLSGIASGDRVALSGALTGVVVGDDASLNADDSFWPTVEAGDAIDQIHLVNDTNDAATSDLILAVTGLSITPDGRDITLQFSDLFPYLGEI